jgi:hypothetical protein
MHDTSEYENRENRRTNYEVWMLEFIPIHKFILNLLSVNIAVRGLTSTVTVIVQLLQ